MVVGIISNIAAISAQINLQQASAQSQSSIYRLSSGNAIYQASDDVGGLAVGTILKTNVSTLKAALSNTSQAQSMLGVADGALSNVGDILQRQKALATQSTSGSLSDQARSFLNQEFSNLAAEVDRISNTTNFNGINLIDGSLYAPSTLTTDASESNSKTVSAVLAINADALFTAGDSVTLAGVTFTAQPTASMTSPLDFDITTNTKAGNITALQSAINATLNSIDPAHAADKKNLSGFNFSFDTVNDKITITAKNGGTVANSKVATSAIATGASGNITLNGNNIYDAANGVSVQFGTGTAGVDGDLTSGTMATGTATAYAGSNTTFAQGIIADSILKALDVNTSASSGIDTSGISNNAAFVGTIKGFKATLSQSGYVDLAINVGNYNYVAKNINTDNTSAQIVRFSSVEDGGGYFDLQFDTATNAGISAGVSTIAEADAFASRLDKAFSGLDFFQKRTVSDYKSGGSIYASGSTASIGNLAGSSFKFINDDFSNIKVQNISVQAPSGGGSNASVTFTINDEEYVSGFDGTGAVLSSGFGDQLSTGSYGFVNVNDAKKMLIFNYNSSTSFDMSTSVNAQAVQTALESAFSINSGASNLTFQVGTTATDTIGVQIQSSKTHDIYTDSTGTYKALDISSLSNAQTATTILDNAINKVTSIRAQVGALESRFKYASNNLNVTIQNQDAARGTFLDTDISIESTNFAQSQVKVQASISVLAQANQLPQSLLKLIG